MSRPARLALTAVLIGTSLGLAACEGGIGDLFGDDDAAKPATPSTTPLADVDTTVVAVARADFCARVAPKAVERALDGPVTDSDAWSNGDDARLGDGVQDVANEFGCVWSAANGAVARAWVFAPPVTRQQAGRLTRQSAGKGCEAVSNAPAFGDPTSAMQCRPREDGDQRNKGTVVVTYSGLFGDAWLTCSLQTSSGPAAARRPSEWCSAVLDAARA